MKKSKENKKKRIIDYWPFTPKDCPRVNVSIKPDGRIPKLILGSPTYYFPPKFFLSMVDFPNSIKPTIFLSWEGNLKHKRQTYKKAKQKRCHLLTTGYVRGMRGQYDLPTECTLSWPFIPSFQPMYRIISNKQMTLYLKLMQMKC